MGSLDLVACLLERLIPVHRYERSGASRVGSLKPASRCRSLIPARYTLMVGYVTVLLRCVQKYLSVSSDAGSTGILCFLQNSVKAAVPAWYVRLVEAATPASCSLLRRAVSAA